jgi:cold shock CspA family protein
VSERYTGTLKFLKHDSGGYGYIVPDGKIAGGDHFVHVRDLHNSGVDPHDLEDGKSHLSYRLEEDSRKNKTKAVDLELLD